MFGIPDHLLGVAVWVGISVLITLYCCFCFLFCRRKQHKEESTLSLAKTGPGPRRLVEVHCSNETSRHSSCYEYPILERARIPCPTHVPGIGSPLHGFLHLHRQNIATVSVIDPQTKLSLNPNIIADEPPPSYDALFP